MCKYSRRRFLKNSTGVAGGALGISALSGLNLPKASAASPIDISVCKWSGDKVPDEEIAQMAIKMTEKVIGDLGGMKRFVSKGDVVWVKPNIGWSRTPEQAANTNPDIVETLVKMCFDAGAKTVKVGDNACNEARETYVMSGIEAAAKKAGAQVVYLDQNRFRKMEIKGKRITEWEVYPEIIETDIVINVPILKHHSRSESTICMKNYMGVVGGTRNTWHQDLTTCITDITRFMKPKLCVLDAVRALMDHGPKGGDLADVKRFDTIIAGTDIVAIDALGAEIMGHESGKLDTVVAGHEAGLGNMNYREKNIKESTVS